MAKFSGASAVRDAQEGRLAGIELPTGQAPVQPEPVAEPTPSGGGLRAEFAAAATDTSQSLREPEGEGLPDAPVQPDEQQQFEADLGEQQRQSIPNLRDRWKGVSIPDPVNTATASSNADGGIINRANKMAQTVAEGGIVPPVSLANTEGFVPAKEGAAGMEVADAIAADKEGSIQAAVNRVNAVDNTNPRSPTVDPDFIKAGSIVTENMIMEFAGGDANADIETEIDPIAEAQGVEAQPRLESDKKITRVAKQQGNAQIGQQIAQEYQRLKGEEVPAKIPAKEAESLGDAFKMMWAAQNPDLVNVTRDPVTRQNYLELTPQGEDVLAQGKFDRKRLFPSKNVKPAKTPLKAGQLPGDTGQNVVKGVQGGVGKQDFGKTLKEAMRNLANVPNVVDPQRLKILYATALPILQNLQNPETFNDWRATINNVGSDKVAKYAALHGETVAEAEIKKVAFKLAQEIQSVAQNRSGANYLSYAIQGFQGRISPQQSKFNPTTSKAVRFVTRNAVKAPAKPGSRVEANLRQMYAMMLVKGADGLLPDQREIKLEAALPKLEEWGDRILETLQMSDADVDAISQAIEQGVALTDPNFPQIGGLNLDPSQDKDLIKLIKDKGEDGPHFIDGVIDASKYAKAKRAGQTYHSGFNAYIDGKTNGIASNGIQMGNSKTARQTGVIRESSTDYLDEHGDVREVLKEELLTQINETGFGGEVSEFSSELNAVARAVFNHRDLNKKTTMTFGYGKEIDTFGSDMYDTAKFLEQDPSQIKDPAMREAFLAAMPEVEERLGNAKDFGDTLMTIYGPALESVMSPEALQTRAIMRGAAILHAATNQLMAIKGPTGMDLHFGRDTRIAEGVETSKYRLRGSKIADGEKEFTSAHQTTEPTSAAARSYEQADGSITEQAGDFAYGGSVVGPVQALDAATVGLSSSGKSWNRLRQASGNNPYMHTIYDAFKTDAMGYDVILEEVNQNWLDASMEWSYLKETKKAVDEKMPKWWKEVNARDPKEKLKDNERAFMDFILRPEMTDKGDVSMKNFYKKIGTAGSFEKRGIKHFEQMTVMADAMRKVGYDWKQPPAEPTVEQLKVFVSLLEVMLKTQSRLGNAINFTEGRKKELKKEILAKGHKTRSGRVIPLQYYAH